MISRRDVILARERQRQKEIRWAGRIANAIELHESSQRRDPEIQIEVERLVRGGTR